MVKDAKHTGVREEITRTIFTPYLQDPNSGRDDVLCPHLAVARRARKSTSAARHAGARFQAGAGQFPNHAGADRRQSDHRARDRDSGVGVRRARCSHGRRRPLRRAGLFDGATHARDRHSHRARRRPQFGHAHGAGRSAVARGNQHCGRAAGVAVAHSRGSQSVIRHLEQRSADAVRCDRAGRGSCVASRAAAGTPRGEDQIPWWRYATNRNSPD